MSGKDGITETLLQELEYLRRRVRELESEGLKSEKEKFESFAAFYSILAHELGIN